jgi:hypothetical protein
MANFYIKFLKRNNETKVGWRPDSRKSFFYADTIREEVRDRRIVSILRKYLDMEFEAGQLSVFNRKDFEALGELLFDLIFTKENLIIEFEDWYSSALKDEEGADAYNIFLEFDLEPEFDDLAILPWEYIHYRPKTKGLIIDEPFFAASFGKKINFYRKIPFTFVDSRDEQLSEIEYPLKILLIISDPTEKPLKKRNELLLYFKELKDNYPEEETLQIKYLYQPNPDQDFFKSELNNGQAGASEIYSLENELGDKIGKHDASFSPHIIHFIGHGFVKDKNGMLIFSEEDKTRGGLFLKKPVTDIKFSNCIKNSRLEPKLVFLQVCNGGRIVDYLNKNGIASRLLEKQIPFVIAMQNPVQEDHALKFTETFYNHFLKGANIGTCVSAGRFELGGQGEFNQKAFGSPVLFTYVDFPLKLKSHDVQSPPQRETREEITTKFCNNPGCPYYRDEARYTPLDKLCSSCGQQLVTKKKEFYEELTMARSGQPEVAVQRMGRESKSPEPVSSSAPNENGRGMAGPNNGNGRFLRQSQQWSPALFKIKGELHLAIDSNIGNALELFQSYVTTDIYARKLKNTEEMYTTCLNTNTLREKTEEIKAFLHRLSDELTENDIKPGYLQ